jgi:hypothetical protein
VLLQHSNSECGVYTSPTRKLGQTAQSPQLPRLRVGLVNARCSAIAKSLALILLLFVLLGAPGCCCFPEVTHQPQFHNPFPQLHRVAILPFFNLTDDPHVDQQAVAQAYFVELQQIPGFEVMPIGVVETKLKEMNVVLDRATDFQQLAQQLGVDVVIRGAVTEYSPYYPPRIGLAVDWFAANPGFHPIPAGYGLPWGTPVEEFIPSSLVHEAEFALAREQLKTQTPDANAPAEGAGESLPTEWPDPRGFVPPPPQPTRPALLAQPEAIITHTRLYDGHDVEITERLAHYYHFRDDARFGGWQAYLQRPEDFLRFCCYLHVTETLAARGGAGESRVVWQWPLSRYEP